MRIVYMGTPSFAVPPLEALIKSEKHTVAAVITQPDKPKGRGGKVQFQAVKETALTHNIPILQPLKMKDEQFLEELRSFNADIFIVAAFGRILKEEILNMPKFGSINIHASLLPKYRGSSPIQQAVINGDDVSGVTIMQMDKGIDTGDMILKKEIPIEPSDTFGTLHDKLSEIGASLVLEALELIENGWAKFEKQDDSKASHAPIISKENGLIDWSSPVRKIVCLIKGSNPWPCAYTYATDKKSEEAYILKIWDAEAVDGELVIKEVQSPGGKRMSMDDFLRGHEGLKILKGSEKNVYL